MTQCVFILVVEAAKPKWRSNFDLPFRVSQLPARAARRGNITEGAPRHRTLGPREHRLGDSLSAATSECGSCAALGRPKTEDNNLDVSATEADAQGNYPIRFHSRVDVLSIRAGSHEQP